MDMVKAQSGFTLLEVIVSVSILTVIAIGIAHLMENTD
ncbi:MAG: prepilin-type N-terminal cleavage/methylation domain-containing protein, partial [Bdellovibrionales bacterium]|nr:prepilin-type N-terminal cleavage/methylation domain-containing protein [Oligoflexia bacterium]